MRKLIFILPFAVMFLGSCLKSDTNSDSQQTITVPVGTFSGQFRKIHRTVATGKLDTVKAAFSVIMSKDSGYKVTADTTKYHAGSKGGFQLTSNYIFFNDLTYPKTGTPAKTHLSGTYLYGYDGSIFQIASPSTLNDSIYYQYDLKKN